MILIIPVMMIGFGWGFWSSLGLMFLIGLVVGD